MRRHRTVHLLTRVRTNFVYEIVCVIKFTQFQHWQLSLLSQLASALSCARNVCFESSAARVWILLCPTCCVLLRVVVFFPKDVADRTHSNKSSRFKRLRIVQLAASINEALSQVRSPNKGLPQENVAPILEIALALGSADRTDCIRLRLEWHIARE